MKTLHKRNDDYARPEFQLKVMKDRSEGSIPPFHEKISDIGMSPLKPSRTEIFQMNLGYMCNQTCKHCHVDAGPDRKEKMSRETLETCIEIVKKHKIPTVDLTGGAPEMHPDFRWLVEQFSEMGVQVMDRCNLTIVVANKHYRTLPEFFAKHQVQIVSSLPHYSSRRTDMQRGDGVFAQSIEALKLLNEVGYGKTGSGLELNLVYNPVGAFLPDSQEELEALFKRKLMKDFGISFNQLFAITNMPIARFLEYLVESGNYETYMEKLLAAYNPTAVPGVMCRNTLSVDYDGYMYDCDFNQMLDLKIDTKHNHVSYFDLDAIENRNILTDLHCYGCTAGAGSSCGGTTT